MKEYVLVVLYGPLEVQVCVFGLYTQNWKTGFVRLEYDALSVTCVSGATLVALAVRLTLLCTLTNWLELVCSELTSALHWPFWAWLWSMAYTTTS
ncbi:MAG: hypothetical protein K6V97_13475 [Actinomycetia bacterium]|nr:hypothetical protein [Actinomycetes bacterium]